jgi:hypothetical protein
VPGATAAGYRFSAFKWTLNSQEGFAQMSMPANEKFRDMIEIIFA